MNGAAAAAGGAAFETTEQRWRAGNLVSASASAVHRRLHWRRESSRSSLHRHARLTSALTVPVTARSGNLNVFIAPINFLDRKDLSQVGIIESYRHAQADKRGEWVEIGQVEAFLAVGTFGGFRRAADALRVTQPAISARIRALEESLGVPLFVRSQSGLALSAAGRAFRPHAEQLLHAVALARQAVHDLRPASGTALQIAAALSICTYVLPDVLKRFQAAHPKVLITVRSGHSKEVLEMVLGGQAEIGLARSLHHPEVET